MRSSSRSSCRLGARRRGGVKVSDPPARRSEPMSPTHAEAGTAGRSLSIDELTELRPRPRRSRSSCASGSTATRDDARRVRAALVLGSIFAAGSARTRLGRTPRSSSSERVMVSTAAARFCSRESSKTSRSRSRRARTPSLGVHARVGDKSIKMTRRCAGSPTTAAATTSGSCANRSPEAGAARRGRQELRARRAHPRHAARKDAGADPAADRSALQRGIARTRSSAACRS